MKKSTSLTEEKQIAHIIEHLLMQSYELAECMLRKLILSKSKKRGKDG